MKITVNKERCIFHSPEFIQNGWASVIPLKVVYNGRDPAAGKALMDAIAEEFITYQYGDYEKSHSISFFASNDWDLFFWCGSTPSGENDMQYFTLGLNERKPRDQQERDFNRLLAFLEAWDDERGRIIAEWHSVDNPEIEAEAAKARLPELMDKLVIYDGKRGRIRLINGCYWFMKQRARRYGYRLTDRAILGIKAA